MRAAPSWDKGRGLPSRAAARRLPYRHPSRACRHARLGKYIPVAARNGKVRKIRTNPRPRHQVACRARRYECIPMHGGNGGTVTTTTTAAMTPPTLGYARPGTFRAPRRHGRWRAWVAAALWIVPVACGTVVLARPALVAGLSIPVTLVLMFA